MRFLEIESATFLIGEKRFNGMITNDKFCCTRWGALQLSWWRRPLRLRRASDEGSLSIIADALRQWLLLEAALCWGVTKRII